MPSINKARISSPLEAGSSLHDSKQLPPELTSALEYISERLARKKLHLTLIVVRKDININIPTFPARIPSPPNVITTSPARSLFDSSASPTATRSSSRTSFSSASTRSLSRTCYPSLPTSPRDASAVPLPASPCSSTGSFSSAPSSPTLPNPYGISLMHAETLTPKAEKILRHYVSKAEKKFGIGTNYLSTQPLTTTITCPSTQSLLRRSLVQNSTIFTSTGLTLLELDHIYTFKCHLRIYSLSLTPLNLTHAVDELHRLVLAQHGRRLTKGYLIRAYDWLGISLSALVDVNEAYKTAYGGPERQGGIDVQSSERRSPPPLKTNFAAVEIRPVRYRVELYGAVEVGESAKGKDGGFEGVVEKEDRGPHRRAPVTPNGFEELTPVTKGEWCFLMVGDGWKEGRRAVVQTC